jgi:hypothetical protein
MSRLGEGLENELRELNGSKIAEKGRVAITELCGQFDKTSESQFQKCSHRRRLKRVHWDEKARQSGWCGG